MAFRLDAQNFEVLRCTFLLALPGLVWKPIAQSTTKARQNYQVEVEMEVVGKSCPQQNRKAIR